MAASQKFTYLIFIYSPAVFNIHARFPARRDLLLRSETHYSYMAWQTTGAWVPPIFRTYKFCLKSFNKTIWIRNQPVANTSMDKTNTKHIREGAGKSLARPGRKQAKATKLEIYSTYSPPAQYTS
jgi:hypothetical protein